jgi:MFS transporter, MHS family, proline/betaine transporter
MTILSIFRKKIIQATFLGNFLEFYEFSLYGFLVPVLSPLFFPSDKGELFSYMQAYLVFGVGFVGRPLGALIFGYLGDLYGRKKALSFSILVMSFATASLGILPTYDQIGIFAPLALALCRFIQGISAGGEYSGASLFSLENYPSKYHGFLGGLLVSGCVSGSLLGALSASLVRLGDASVLWRIPFILSLGIGLLGFYIRRRLSESKAFRRMKATQPLSGYPLLDVLKKDLNNFVSVISVAGLCGSTHYFIFIFANTYLTHLGYSQGFVYGIIQATMFFNIACLLFIGNKVNRFGYINLIQMAAGFTFVVSILLVIFLKLKIYSVILVGLFLISFLNACAAAPSHAFMFNAFETKRRYSGTSFAYSLGICYIGGMTPYISTTLMSLTGNNASPLYYLAFTGFFCLVCLLYKKPIKYVYLTFNVK